MNAGQNDNGKVFEWFESAEGVESDWDLANCIFFSSSVTFLQTLKTENWLCLPRVSVSAFAGGEESEMNCKTTTTNTYPPFEWLIKGLCDFTSVYHQKNNNNCCFLTVGFRFIKTNVQLFMLWLQCSSPLWLIIKKTNKNKQKNLWSSRKQHI